MEKQNNKRKAHRKLGVVVKETVDFIYDYLIQHPDGTIMNISELGSGASLVGTVLVKRGIISKKKEASGHVKYKWEANSKPTSVLYGSIHDEIRDGEARRRAQKKARMHGYGNPSESAKKTPTQAVEGPYAEVPYATAHVEDVTVQPAVMPEPEPVPICAPKNPFDGFSAQELWDELQARGFFIKDGQLAIQKINYLINRAPAFGALQNDMR